MVLVSEVKDGMAVRLDGKIYKVLETVHHAGSGQMHGFIELKLRDLKFGHFADRRFKFTDKIEQVELTKRPMDFLYADADSYYFMDPETFNQVSVPKSYVRIHEKFLKEGLRANIELHGEEIMSVDLPKIMELRVASTGPGLHEGQDNTMKPANLENGIEVQVPQFVITGDLVRIDTEKMKYLDRITTKKI